ncbi:uncharacterized protein KY384_001515 [Bacidia gigantensis]|uniref:uncharacterized protein n=1 Tax=Bacidia gigantensis TaxID=2732470 RepID=UPI001D058E03|nr:uncharacterized protein KY384_001515 [Bacidia gigantensis]KAG8533774.1 hypothetical protein KY384_001515 [Bacidia gigantensis]
MPTFLNPFQKHDVSDFPDTYVPLSQAQRHPSVVDAYGNNLAGLAPGTDGDKDYGKDIKGDDSPTKSGSFKNAAEGGVDELTLDALRAEIDADVSAYGHDSAYDRKAKVINKALMDIGMGSYQWQLFVLCGFGWLADNLWLQTVALTLPSLTSEFGPSETHVRYTTCATFIGLCIGASFWGVASDVIGRRLAFNATLFIAGIFGLSIGGGPNWIGTCGLYAALGVGIGGNLPVDGALFLEFIPAASQGLLTLLSVWWPVGQLLTSLFAWGFLVKYKCDSELKACSLVGPGEACCHKNMNWGWRYLNITCGALTFLMFSARFFFFHLFESPKFLLSRGRQSEAVATVHGIAWKNGKKTWISEEVLNAIGGDPEVVSGQKLSFTETISRFFSKFSTQRIGPLFANKKLGITTGLIWFCWTTIGMGYPLFNAFLPQYLAQSGNNGPQSNDIVYRNYAITSIVGVPGSIIAYFTVDIKYIGRKGTIASSTLITGIFVFLFTASTDSNFQLAFTCLEAFFQNIMYGVLYAYTPEVFPAPNRGTAVNAGEANPKAPIYASGGLFIAAFIAMCCFPIETRVLSARSIIALNAVSKRFYDITSDNELWRHRCFNESPSQYARPYGLSRSRSVRKQLQERTALNLERALTGSSGRTLVQGNARSRSLGRSAGGAEESISPENRRFASQINGDRNIASWDPTVPGEKVDWYQEYIARHAPLALDWLPPPQPRQGLETRGLEAKGVGILNNEKVLAPLEDGSICIWDIGDSFTSITARSSPGILTKPSLGSLRRPQLSSSPASNSAVTEIGSVECVSVDSSLGRAYMAIEDQLHEVDLNTLQMVTSHHYPQHITALSEGSHPAPLTVGTTQSLHIHDPRMGRSNDMPATNIREYLEDGKAQDFHRIYTGDSIHASLEPLPLSILHNGTNMIHVAGRFPSILNYDRRHFPQISSTVHTGARLSCIAHVPSDTPSTSTLAAAGEYGTKGSLELYHLSETGSLAGEPTRNRATTSSSKCLSLVAQGTRLLFSDSDGLLKWVERDCSTLVRRWNVNTTYSSTLNEPGRPSTTSGIFNAEINAGDVARKLISVDGHDAKGDIVIWTGERIGVMSYGQQRKDLSGKGKGRGKASPDIRKEPASDTPSDEERDYSTMMRRALEKQADEVRFVRGLGLGNRAMQTLCPKDNERNGARQKGRVEPQRLFRRRHLKGYSPCRFASPES